MNHALGGAKGLEDRAKWTALIQDVKKSTMKIGFSIQGRAMINDQAQAVMFQPHLKKIYLYINS